MAASHVGSKTALPFILLAIATAIDRTNIITATKITTNLTNAGAKVNTRYPLEINQHRKPTISPFLNPFFAFSSARVEA